MAANITVLYGGEAAEVPALDFTALLAVGLGARAECRFTRDPLGALSVDQRTDYRNLIEMSGWNPAHTYLVETSQGQVRELSAAAAETFRRLPTSAHLAWGTPVDLSDKADAELTTLGFTRDLLVASFNLNEGVRNAVLKRALLGAGAPVALVAHAPAAPRLEEATLVFAWKPSAAAKHALRYALPLLRKARRVHLLTIEEDGAPPQHPSAQAIADYLLDVHSVSVQASGLRAADSPALQLAEFYQEVGADLLVMGPIRCRGYRRCSSVDSRSTSSPAPPATCCSRTEPDAPVARSRRSGAFAVRPIAANYPRTAAPAGPAGSCGLRARA